MAELTWVSIATLVIGNGLVITIISLAFQHYLHKSQKDFDARKEAKNYYMSLYSRIAMLDEYISGYPRSLETGKANVFDFDKKEYSEFASQEILFNFKIAYENFSSFYIEKKCEGCEIFVSKKLKEILISYWLLVKSFYDDTDKMKNKQEVKNANKLAEKTTQQMEKLFGLK